MVLNNERSMKRTIREKLKDLMGKMFILGQHFGFDLLPRHFYSEIPDIRKLKSSGWWKKKLSMIGVSMEDLETQLEFINSLMSDAVTNEIQESNVYGAACSDNCSGGFGRIEADVLYAFIRTVKPRKIFQIGCGVSTALCINASNKASYKPQITCVEPYPSDFLKNCQKGRIIKLIDEPIEHLEASCISNLEDGDLLFVDSTHTLGPAGEGSRIILELLPRLNVGVHIHFHDILFPYDYPSTILQRPQFFPHESVLLHAFLTYNDCFKIIASLSLLHYEKQIELQAILKNYVPARHEQGLRITKGDFPSSTYLRRTKA